MPVIRTSSTTAAVVAAAVDVVASSPLVPLDRDSSVLGASAGVGGGAFGVGIGAAKHIDAPTRL